MTFQQIYDQRPDPSNFGGSGYSRMKNLYDMCMRLKPEVIIESGTWKGNSSWVFRNACPDARIHCFDIKMSNLKYISGDIDYHECDIVDWWKDHWWTFNRDEMLIFFDDHVSHLDRLNWAYINRFKHIIFDDNFSEEECKKLKAPPTPTLKMINLLYWIEEYEILPFHGRDKETYITYIRTS